MSVLFIISITSSNPLCSWWLWLCAVKSAISFSSWLSKWLFILWSSIKISFSSLLLLSLFILWLWFSPKFSCLLSPYKYFISWSWLLYSSFKITLKSQASIPLLETLVILVSKPCIGILFKAFSKTSTLAPKSISDATNISPLIPE